jgi:hypothetical protein
MVRADGIGLLPRERDHFTAGEVIMVNPIRHEIEMEEA